MQNLGLRGRFSLNLCILTWVFLQSLCLLAWVFPRACANWHGFELARLIPFGMGKVNIANITLSKAILSCSNLPARFGDSKGVSKLTPSWCFVFFRRKRTRALIRCQERSRIARSRQHKAKSGGVPSHYISWQRVSAQSAVCETATPSPPVSPPPLRPRTTSAAAAVAAPRRRPVRRQAAGSCCIFFFAYKCAAAAAGAAPRRRPVRRLAAGSCRRPRPPARRRSEEVYWQWTRKSLHEPVIVHVESWIMLYSTHLWYIAMTPYKIAKGRMIYSCQGCYLAGFDKAHAITMCI